LLRFANEFLDVGVKNSGISGLDPSTMALSAEQARNILATEAAGEGARDHSEYLGAVAQLDIADSAFSRSPLGQQLRTAIGEAFLSAIWTDPDFKPGIAASYYARVLEIPTPRWSSLLAIRNHLPVPTRVAATLQERAWSSPIWFTP
jgi:hypothetical protein